MNTLVCSAKIYILYIYIYIYTHRDSYLQCYVMYYIYYSQLIKYIFNIHFIYIGLFFFFVIITTSLFTSIKLVNNFCNYFFFCFRSYESLTLFKVVKTAGCHFGYTLILLHIWKHSYAVSSISKLPLYCKKICNLRSVRCTTVNLNV